MSKEVILTGIRSNDEPTLGNYLGAFLPMVELQAKHAGTYQLNMFVPDLHSFITPIDHAHLFNNTAKNLKYFIASGLDMHNPDTFIYRQSYIPSHSELAWILGCFTYFGELRRMTQFKDKAFQHTAVAGIGDEPTTEDNLDIVSQHVSAGLFYYPVLMAADILLYGAKWIPVGDDQRQHLELTRDIAVRLNNKFGALFTVPEPWDKQLEFSGRAQGVRIRSLRNPEKKMSKSTSDPAGTILLSDAPEDAAKKVMAATTDSIGSIHFDHERQPGVSNLIQILALLKGQALPEVVDEWDGKSNYGELKRAVAEHVEMFLHDFQTKFNAIDEEALIHKLLKDEAVMDEAAAVTLHRVQKAIGLRYE